VIEFRFEPGPVHLIRLEAGDDLYEAITLFATERDIRAATVAFLGAVRRASLRYYDQQQKRYVDFDVDRHLEIVSGVGNISVLDGAPFVHIHAAFADELGAAFGGHVNTGTEVFLCEVTVSELRGSAPVRQLDETTGLMVWGPPGA
jgi:predicted DNA-binding protein with PD1-like motif